MTAHHEPSRGIEELVFSGEATEMALATAIDLVMRTFRESRYSAYRRLLRAESDGRLTIDPISSVLRSAAVPA